jgi:site-specific recombinase XerD
LSNRSKTLLFLDFRQWMFDEKGFTNATREGYSKKVQTIDRRLAALNTNVAGCSLTALRQAYITLTPDPTSRNSYRSALVCFYDFLTFRGLRADNPAQALPRLRQPRGLPRPLEEVDHRRYWDAARALGPKHQAVAALGLFAGLRIHEAAKLEWVDITEGGLRILGKGRKMRIVPLHPTCSQSLVAWRAASKDPRWVFPCGRSDKAVEPHSFYKWHLQIIDAAGLRRGRFENGYHRLRHTMATEALDASGGDLRAVQELLGHSSPATTAIYTKVRDGRLGEVVTRLYARRDPNLQQTLW